MRMEISIKYFGLLVELTGCSEEKINIEHGDISKFLNILYNKYPKLQDVDFKVAQNKIIVKEDIALDGEEIALLPPYSGG